GVVEGGLAGELPGVGEVGVGGRHVAGERAVDRAVVEAQVVPVGKARGVVGGERLVGGEGAALHFSGPGHGVGGVGGGLAGGVGDVGGQLDEGDALERAVLEQRIEAFGDADV